MMTRTLSAVLRSWSVSSIRRTNVPPVFRAQSQLKSAVRTPPMCRYPVGDGAKRTRVLMRDEVARSKADGAVGFAASLVADVELGGGGVDRIVVGDARAGASVLANPQGDDAERALDALE